MRKFPLAPLILVGVLLAAAAVLWSTLGSDSATPPPIDMRNAARPTRAPQKQAPKPKPDDAVPDLDAEPLPAADTLEPAPAAPDEPFDPVDEQDVVTAITGKVITPAAIPARGATVTLLRELPGTPLRPGKTKRAQPPMVVADDGSFGFTGLKAGATYFVRADHPDFPPATAPGARAVKDQTIELPDLEFVVGCSILGTVNDDHGRAMKAARVVLFDAVRGGPLMAPQDRTPVAVVETDAQGGFKLERLAPGVYEIMVTAPKYEAAFVPNIDISSPRAERRVPIALAPGHSIAGKVVDLEGAPVAGASVQATQVTKDVKRFGTALTDAGGRYRVDGLGLGNYRMSVEKAGYGSAQRERVAADSLGVHFRLVQNAGITGFVRATDGATPVPAFGIMLYALGKGDRPNQPIGGMHSFSARDGSYTIEDVAPGRYKLKVFADGFGPTWSEPVAVEHIFVHGTDIVLETGAVVTGLVADVDGTPAVGATVLLLENAFRRNPSAAMLYGSFTHYASAKTDADGRFSMKDIEPKRYQIEVQMSDRMPLSVRDVEVARGVNEIPGLRLKLGGGIKGTVLNEHGAPANAGRVSARNLKTEASYEAVCDAEGQFEFAHLEPGDWTLVPAPPASDPFANHPLAAITVAMYSQQTVTVVDGRSEIVTLPIKTSK